MGRTISREQLLAKRETLKGECKDYVPTRGGYQCQHYAGRGACKREDYFMCVVWVKRNPDDAADALRDEQPAQQEARRREPRRYNETTTKLMRSSESPRTAQVYDLSHGIKKEGERHMLQRPELLTEAAVEELSARSIEVVVTTQQGTEVTLVPAYTKADRCELTYRDARTLVLLLQVFPNATLDQIKKPNEAAS